MGPLVGLAPTNTSLRNWDAYNAVLLNEIILPGIPIELLGPRDVLQGNEALKFLAVVIQADPHDFETFWTETIVDFLELG